MPAPDLVFVRKAEEPELAPPRRMSGILGWLRANLFSSIGNTLPSGEMQLSTRIRLGTLNIDSSPAGPPAFFFLTEPFSSGIHRPAALPSKWIFS